MTDTQSRSAPSGNFIEVFIAFLKLGLTSFGGPMAHIGFFRKEFVEKRGWVTESQFGQLLAICQFLPGPASSQLGFAIGLLRSGWLGAISAFIAFTLPSAILLILFATSLDALSNDWGQAAIHGLKLVACAVVADAVLGMSKKLCPDLARKTIALLAIVILLILSSTWTQIGVVILGALAGVYWCKEPTDEKLESFPISYGKRVGTGSFTLFLLMLLGTPYFLGISANEPALHNIASAFYNAGALVFGGGHVVLPLLEESTVTSGWIPQENFLAGYGASQAIPGPMFAFSAYLGAIIPTGLPAWIGAVVALLFMFVPGFLLIIAALPAWKTVSHNQTARNAIAGVNAAVVGLLAAVLYDPIFTSGVINSTDLAIAIIGFGMLTIWKLSPLYVVFWCIGSSVIFMTI